MFAIRPLINSLYSGIQLLHFKDLIPRLNEACVDYFRAFDHYLLAYRSDPDQTRLVEAKNHALSLEAWKSAEAFALRNSMLGLKADLDVYGLIKHHQSQIRLVKVPAGCRVYRFDSNQTLAHDLEGWAELNLDNLKDMDLGLDFFRQNAALRPPHIELHTHKFFRIRELISNPNLAIRIRPVHFI